KADFLLHDNGAPFTGVIELFGQLPAIQRASLSVAYHKINSVSLSEAIRKDDNVTRAALLRGIVPEGPAGKQFEEASTWQWIKFAAGVPVGVIGGIAKQFTELGKLLYDLATSPTETAKLMWDGIKKLVELARKQEFLTILSVLFPEITKVVKLYGE